MFLSCPRNALGVDGDNMTIVIVELLFDGGCTKYQAMAVGG